MGMRSAVATLGATLVLAVALGTIATPAFAAKSHATPTATPTTVDAKGRRASVEPTMMPTMSESAGRASRYEQEIPSPTIEPVSSAQAAEQPTPASVVSTGSTVPGVPAGSVVPGGNPGAPLASGSVVSSSSAQIPYQSSYPYQAGPAASTTSNGSAHPPAPTAAASPVIAAEPAHPAQSLFANSIGSNAQSGGGPDVRVVYVNSASNSNSTLYHFRVENVGSRPATGINLSSVVREQSSTSNATRRIEEQYAQIGMLAVGQSQDLVVTCTPRDGFQCVGGALDAFVADDLSVANNKAQS